ncbi:hypothetical protein PVL29_015731 [Vitis rotundifolia]|uniref:Uncharacterized protein n=1 Tax=Vitis rotundifolia TaxID=103349 RepID=A0AA39DJC1_VITRO|nr:hypothetical protein PVL29_015731 [Vitis rotundifolia]
MHQFLCLKELEKFRSFSNEDEKAFTKSQAMESRLCREERNCPQERNFRPSATANKLHAFRYLHIQLLLQVLLRPGESSETLPPSPIVIHGPSIQTCVISKLIGLNSIDYARFILDQTPSPTDFPWNSFIKADTLQDSSQNSLVLYL